MKKSINVKPEKESLDKVEKRNLETICNMEGVSKGVGNYWNEDIVRHEEKAKKW